MLCVLAPNALGNRHGAIELLCARIIHARPDAVNTGSGQPRCSCVLCETWTSAPPGQDQLQSVAPLPRTREEDERWCKVHCETALESGKGVSTVFCSEHAST
eukprot:1307242-Rhodomonas_salina.2